MEISTYTIWKFLETRWIIAESSPLSSDQFSEYNKINIPLIEVRFKIWHKHVSQWPYSWIQSETKPHLKQSSGLDVICWL